MIKKFKIKLSAKELPELCRLYDFYIKAWESEDPHEYLLLHMAMDLHHELARKINPAAKKYTVCLSIPAALAFFQWWQKIDTAGDEYGNVIICKIIGAIDKVHHEAAIRFLTA
jgi:hypothetical protein